jgi:PAS domain S-box-containing protein
MEWNETICELKFLFDAFHNGIVMVNKDGLITIYNQAAGRVLKKNPDDMIGRHASEVLPHAWGDMRLILKSGISQIGLKLTIDESTIVANRTPIKMDGKVVGIISVFQDISEYEKIITELQTYKRLTKELDAIINSSYDGLYVTDGKANTIRVNKAYERISGLKAKDIVGRNMKELVEKGYFDRSVTLEVLKTKRPVTIMQDIRGGIKTMVTGNPILDEEKQKIILVVTNVRDVSELDSLRKQLEDSRRISEKYLSELQELRLHNMKNQKLIINSGVMRNIMHTAMKVAKTDTSVLITGETGVGKGLVARIIHNNSQREEQPFIKINCGAIPETLLESELFGYERGAFTGARSEGKPGFFEVAEGGTLFLDEIGELPLHLQVKLLSILEDKEVIRLGGTKPRPINVRIIAASNRDLKDLVEERKFRRDLFFRLDIIPIRIPPLRKRKDDIFPLISCFLSKFNQIHGKKTRILGDALDLLILYSYPGNIRELQNIIERLVVISDSDIIGVRDLPNYVLEKKPEAGLPAELDMDMNLNRLLKSIEARFIEDSIRKYGTTYRAAKHLGMSQSTVVRKMQRYSIQGNDAEPH